MRILLLVHAFNSLSQRIFVELEKLGHEVSVEFDIHDEVSVGAAEQFAPDVIVAPFLKRAIPETIWSRYICLIVHPGIRGDRGPSALDWAVLSGEERWGVTVLQANAQMDAGPVWAHAEFDMRAAAKSSLYRDEVTSAALKAVKNAIARLQSGETKPPQFDNRGARGIKRPLVRQADRCIDWRADTTQEVLRKIRSADGVPGVKDEINGRTFYLYDASEATGINGAPGQVVAKSGPAICRATTDGAIWIGHLRDASAAPGFKLPATHVLAGELDGVSELPVDSAEGYREIRYEEAGEIGYLYFDFYNGAMGTDALERLLAAYQKACARPTKIIVLTGGAEFWSNGMNLNLIEAASSPADESWRNINAMDDLAEAIIKTGSHLTIAAMAGNAGAGGVFLARAADYLWLRRAVVLNPHYKDMGNLYGSEFWTYLLPLYTGAQNARRIMQSPLPMGADEAVRLGLADAVFGGDKDDFADEVCRRTRGLCRSGQYEALLEQKRVRRKAHERAKSLSAYRAQELENMRRNFYGPDPSYHVARYNFVCKVEKSRTPRALARHRSVQMLNTKRRVS